MSDSDENLDFSALPPLDLPIQERLQYPDISALPPVGPPTHLGQRPPTRLEEIAKRVGQLDQHEWYADDVTLDWDPDLEYCHDEEGEECPCRITEEECCEGHPTQFAWSVHGWGGDTIEIGDYSFLTEHLARFLAHSKADIRYLIDRVKRVEVASEGMAEDLKTVIAHWEER